MRQDEIPLASQGLDWIWQKRRNWGIPCQDLQSMRRV